MICLFRARVFPVDVHGGDVAAIYIEKCYPAMEHEITSFCKVPGQVRPGRNTDDGQVVLSASTDRGWAERSVHTPRFDDPDFDGNANEPAIRMYQAGTRVSLARFADAEVNGSVVALVSESAV